MTKQELFDFGAKYNLSQYGPISVGGIFKGYLILLNHNKNGTITISISVQISKNDRSLLNDFNKLMRHCKIVAAPMYWKDNYFSFFAAKKHLNLHSLDYILNETISALRELSISPVKNCGVCGNPDCDGATFYGDVFTPVHKDCIYNNTDKTLEYIIDQESNSSLLKGILSGFIGMIIGTIPILALMIFLGYIHSGLFALVPIAIMWFYKKAGGPSDNRAKVVLVLFTILSVYFIGLIHGSFSAMLHYGISYGMALITIIKVYFLTPQGLIQTTKDGAMFFAFAFAGLIVCWKRITVTNKEIIATSENIEAFMIDIDSMSL